MAAAERPALVLPKAQAGAAPAASQAPSFADKPVPAPLGAPGSLIRIDGVTGAVLARIAAPLGCPVPASLAGADGQTGLPVAPLDCVAAALGTDLGSMAGKQRGRFLQKIDGMVRTQAAEDEAAGGYQAFSSPFRVRFGGLEAYFSSNIHSRLGACEEAEAIWDISTRAIRSVTKERIAAGRAPPIAAFLLSRVDVAALLLSTPLQIRRRDLPHAICTRARPDTARVTVRVGGSDLAAFEVPADALIDGGEAWAAAVLPKAEPIRTAANAVFRSASAANYVDAERFRKTYGDFRNVALMSALISGTYRTKDFLPAHQLAVRRMFVRYHVLYSDHCYETQRDDLTQRQKALLGAEKAFVTRSFVYRTRNRRTDETVGEPRVFHIREAYADRVYELAQEELNRTHNDLFLEQGIETWARAAQDIDLFFERQGCFGSHVDRFEKNLFAAAMLDWDPQRERGTAPQIFLPGINLK